MSRNRVCAVCCADCHSLFYTGSLYLLTVLFKEPQLEALVKLELFVVPELQKMLLGCTDGF